ncbi:hypothetical protein F3Y22_tig00110937pilonHSYRG00001 [Hibiscus syriacus]|uniref:RRM domain-containing protein n=1 Tax=Hibiscus syriacus TaxID=106335 RepID=A0A6A2ZET0_HIBSY|nr:hypothetical protein F3Y22_tig00110937pilonHSYRG00001 [Hibiscus syriacus]
MIPEQWASPCGNQCTHKYAALMQIPWRVFCKKGCSADGETWEECLSECDEICYKDPVLKDQKWSAYMDRSPGATNYSQNVLGIAMNQTKPDTYTYLKLSQKRKDEHLCHMEAFLRVGLFCYPDYSLLNMALPKKLKREKGRVRESAIGGQSSGEEWTAFVNFLSKRVTWRTLKEIFQQHGSVIRVYIPSSSTKQNYRNYTFAFVQFEKEDGLMKAIANLNGIWIDGKKVSVGVAKYQKQRSRQEDNRDVRRVEGKWKIGTTLRRRSRSVSISKLRDERTYKDVLVSYDEQREVQGNKEFKEGRPGEKEGLRNVWEMHIPLDEYDWVKRSLTGIIKSQFDLELVEKGLASDGIIVRGAKWGYTWNSCILTFDSVEELEKARTSRGEELLFWFDWLDPLMSEEGVPLAFCSVELVGIPLLCWNESFLEKLLSKWGKLVCIHESTIKREDMAVARALLKVASPFDIQEFVNMGSYGRSFKVKINLGSVSIKQESFAVKKSMVAGDGVYSNDAQPEKEDDNHSVGVGKLDLIAKDSRDTYVRGLVGENYTSMVGGKGEEHLLSQELQSQNSGAMMSELPDGILNLKGDYRGLGLRDDFIVESVAAQSVDSSEDHPISFIGPGVNQTNLGFGKGNESRLETLVEPQQSGSDKSNVQKKANDPSYLFPKAIPGGVVVRLQPVHREDSNKSNEVLINEGTFLNKEASSEEGIEEVREEKSMHMNQESGCYKESHTIGLSSWSPFNHLPRSLHLGGWKRGPVSRVYRRSRGRKVWFNPRRENGSMFPLEVSDHNRSRNIPTSSILPITNISGRSPIETQDDDGSSQKADAVRSQLPRGDGEGVKGNKHGSEARTGIRRKKRILIREALDVASIPTVYSPNFSLFLEEALATWEVSKLLGISFKEGKKAFLDKIINMEKDIYMVKMKIISWNIRGIRKKEKSRAVATMVRNYKPGILLIQETKLEKCSQAIRRRIGGSILNSWTVVPAVGSAGGLMVLWNDKDFEVTNSHLSSRFIAVFGSFKNSCDKCVIINVYGPSIDAEKEDFFRELLNFVTAQTVSVCIGDLELKINNLEFKAQAGDLCQQDWGHLLQFRSDLWRLYRIEESIWSRRNEITSLKINGSEVVDPQSIKLHIAAFFKESYSSMSTLGVEDLSLEFAMLSEFQSLKLEEQFTEQEIWQAIASSDSSKAPGPDGFTMGFFKKCWSGLKEHVLKFFQDFFRGRKWEHGVNHAFITLIPKKTNPESVEDFRPISLVGSLYKILSKVLSKRLSGCVGDIISQSQFAFIPGRQLLDCAFIANEGIDFWRKQGLQGVVFKVDFRRAYDTVEWPILFRAMKEMGFGNRWSSWITQCLSTASISILVNGSPSEEFAMEKEGVLSDWAEQVGCSVGFLPTEYLGLPLGARKNTEALWDPVFKNFSSKLAGWKASCLSLAGRTVLLKSVLTSLPIFFLSLFKMPCNIGKKLNSLMANFLWGEKGDKRRIHWVNWNTVCRPLNCGGLGVLDLNLTNRALLGKWVWKFANDKNSLWKSVLCSKQKMSWNTMSIGKVTSPKSSWILRGIANNFLRMIRIYVLSINKGGEIVEFGSYGPSGWEWNVQTRRNHQWENIGSEVGSNDVATRSLEGFGSTESGSFLWQLAHQKLAVKAELGKLDDMEVYSRCYLLVIWKARNAIVFEVEWIKSPALAPVFYLSLVNQILTLSNGKVHSVRWIPRASNGEADSLAKKGIG